MCGGMEEEATPAVSFPEAFILVWSLSLPIFLSFRERYGTLEGVVFHPLAGDGTGLHFEYMFKSSLERVYYCHYFFPCWLCLILYEQISNCKGISQALANVCYCATGYCVLYNIWDKCTHILGALQSKEILQAIGCIIKAVL